MNELERLSDHVEQLHIITGPNGQCLCGRDGMTCGQILAMLSRDVRDAQIVCHFKRIGERSGE